MKQGIFYAVGVGAGDPMDMTLRAKAVLEQADIIVTPIPKAGGTSAAYAIAAQAADLSHAERLDILFPMQAHNDYRERLRSGVLQPVCAALDSGRQVAMVTLGDVSVYSTASYVRQLLAEKGCRVYLLGGEFKSQTEAIVGEEAMEMLSKYNFTKGFWGTNGISVSKGYSTPEIKEAMVKKYSMKNCKRCYILADASKFDQLSSVKFADFEQATILTTELYKPALKKYKNIVEVKE